jgi:hypothetical protein
MHKLRELRSAWGTSADDRIDEAQRFLWSIDPEGSERLGENATVLRLVDEWIKEGSGKHRRF